MAKVSLQTRRIHRPTGHIGYNEHLELKMDASFNVLTAMLKNTHVF